MRININGLQERRTLTSNYHDRQRRHLFQQKHSFQNPKKSSFKCVLPRPSLSNVTGSAKCIWSLRLSRYSTRLVQPNNALWLTMGHWLQRLIGGLVERLRCPRTFIVHSHCRRLHTGEDRNRWVISTPPPAAEVVNANSDVGQMQLEEALQSL